MNRSCPPDPRLNADRRGYGDACFVCPSALEAYDDGLDPFDVMEQATLPASGAWTNVAVYQVIAGKYAVLRHIGQDANDPRAYQWIDWRVQVNGRNRGGDRNGLIPALEARCGILDGQLMPYRLFAPQGAWIALQARVTSGAAETVVRGRLQGETRTDSLVGAG